jgi:hypothetical protein
MTKTMRTTANFAGWCILTACGLLLPAIALCAGPAKKPPARDTDWPPCELILGKHVEKLALTDTHGQSVAYRLRGSSMFLPPGQYVVEEIDLQGGFSANPYPRIPADQVTLAPGKPFRFDIRGPLTSSVTAQRSGRLLKLNYQLLDGDGRKYRGKGDRAHPPQFAVYQGDQQIGSGSFEYG